MQAVDAKTNKENLPNLIAEIKEELSNSYTIKREDGDGSPDGQAPKKQKIDAEDKCDLFSWFGYPTKSFPADQINYSLLHKRQIKFLSYYHPDKPTGDEKTCKLLNMVRQIANQTYNATAFPLTIID